MPSLPCLFRLLLFRQQGEEQSTLHTVVLESKELAASSLPQGLHSQVRTVRVEKSSRTAMQRQEWAEVSTERLPELPAEEPAAAAAAGSLAALAAHTCTVLSPLQVASTGRVGCQEACQTLSLWPLREHCRVREAGMAAELGWMRVGLRVWT